MDPYVFIQIQSTEESIVSNLVFYTQSTIAVKSGWQRKGKHQQK